MLTLFLLFFVLSSGAGIVRGSVGGACISNNFTFFGRGFSVFRLQYFYDVMLSHLPPFTSHFPLSILQSGYVSLGCICECAENFRSNSTDAPLCDIDTCLDSIEAWQGERCGVLRCSARSDGNTDPGDVVGECTSSSSAICMYCYFSGFHI